MRVLVVISYAQTALTLRLRLVLRIKALILKQISDVHAQYEVMNDKELGRGHYGIVRQCKHRKTGATYAVKTVEKRRVWLDSLRREVEILQMIRHPNVVRIVDMFEDESHLHIVTELCQGGELFDRIIERTRNGAHPFSEATAGALVRSILEACDYFHGTCRIVHRDLKPENFLFRSEKDDSDIVIIDFGLSRICNNGVAMQTRVGTPYYIAPEVLQRNYTEACDIWSVGVITYVMLCGYPPFFGGSEEEIFEAVRHAHLNFPPRAPPTPQNLEGTPDWEIISPEAKRFVARLLQRDPTARPTALEALHDPWFDRLASTKTVEPDKANNPKTLVMGMVGVRLQRFIGFNALKKLALNVIAGELEPTEVGNLQQVFRSIDRNNDGQIDVEELRSALVAADFTEFSLDIVDTLIEGADIDFANAISYRNFLAAMMERHLCGKDDKLQQAFVYFDQSKADSISLDDLISAFDDTVIARDIMESADINGDGRLDFSEFREAMLAKAVANTAAATHGRANTAAAPGVSDSPLFGGRRLSNGSPIQQNSNDRVPHGEPTKAEGAARGPVSAAQATSKSRSRVAPAPIPKRPGPSASERATAVEATGRLQQRVSEAY